MNERINFLFRKLRLEDLLYKITGELSSDKKIGSVSAKALINDPTVLLLDEPTAALDPETADFIRTFLEKAQRRKKNICFVGISQHG